MSKHIDWGVVILCVLPILDIGGILLWGWINTGQQIVMFTDFPILVVVGMFSLTPICITIFAVALSKGKKMFYK